MAGAEAEDCGFCCFCCCGADVVISFCLSVYHSFVPSIIPPFYHSIIYPSVYLSIYLSVSFVLSFYLSFILLFVVSIILSVIYLSLYCSVHHSVAFVIGFFLCHFIYLSVCLPFWNCYIGSSIVLLFHHSIIWLFYLSVSLSITPCSLYLFVLFCDSIYHSIYSSVILLKLSICVYQTSIYWQKFTF